MSKISNKEVLDYGVLESINDLTVFVGHIHFKKLMKFRKFIEIFHCWMTRLRNISLGFFIPCQYTRTILRNKNMGQSLFKKHSKFLNLNEIFYCGLTRFRNTNLHVFIQCRYTRTTLRKNNMGQSLIKKHSKILNFDEIFYCDMTKLRNSILNYCGLCRYVKAIKPKKVVRKSLFKNHLVSKFQYSIKFFTTTFSNAGTNNRKRLENIFTQKLL